MIRLTIPTIEEDDLQAVREALVSGYLVQGPRVAAFEQSVADYIGTSYAVAVNNCTSALLLSLMALEIGAGDRVATKGAYLIRLSTMSSAVPAHGHVH